MFMSNGSNQFSSPMVCLDTAFKLTSNRINKPIEDDNYAHDPRVNRLTGDLIPHTISLGDINQESCKYHESYS